MKRFRATCSSFNRLQGTSTPRHSLRRTGRDYSNREGRVLDAPQATNRVCGSGRVDQAWPFWSHWHQQTRCGGDGRLMLADARNNVPRVSNLPCPRCWHGNGASDLRRLATDRQSGSCRGQESRQATRKTHDDSRVVDRGWEVGRHTCFGAPPAGGAPG